LHASQAAEFDLRITLRNSLAPVLEAAGLTMPQALLAANLEREREQALKLASEAYAEANRLLDNVAEGQRDESLAGAAQVARILTLYGWSQLERQANDERAAEEHLRLAMDYRKAALEQNMKLPPLPAALGGISAAVPATAPGSATAPTSPTPAPDVAAPAAPAQP
jgi:hypothetical protein